MELGRFFEVGGALEFGRVSRWDYRVDRVAPGLGLQGRPCSPRLGLQGRPCSPRLGLQGRPCSPWAHRVREVFHKGISELGRFFEIGGA